MEETKSSAGNLLVSPSSYLLDYSKTLKRLGWGFETAWAVRLSPLRHRDMMKMTG
jgi:hypothetical protein